jgi:hypothetical protein
MDTLIDGSEVEASWLSLETLRVSLPDNLAYLVNGNDATDELCDGSFLLERSLQSESLKDIYLSGFLLMIASDRALRHRQALVVNESVKKNGLTRNAHLETRHRYSPTSRASR